jgi:hypothetical protein
MDVKLVERVAEAPPAIDDVAAIDGVAATLNRLQLDATARRATATPSSRRSRVDDAVERTTRTARTATPGARRAAAN